MLSNALCWFQLASNADSWCQLIKLNYFCSKNMAGKKFAIIIRMQCILFEFHFLRGHRTYSFRVPIVVTSHCLNCKFAPYFFLFLLASLCNAKRKSSRLDDDVFHFITWRKSCARRHRRSQRRRCLFMHNKRENYCWSSNCLSAMFASGAMTRRSTDRISHFMFSCVHIKRTRSTTMSHSPFMYKTHRDTDTQTVYINFKVQDWIFDERHAAQNQYPSPEVVSRDGIE